MRVAIVGGTGPFGRALAARLVGAGVDVVVGSRDEARAQEAARELGCAGATNAHASAGADLVILAVNAEAALDTARELRDAIGDDARALRRVGAAVHEGRRAPFDRARRRLPSESRPSSTGPVLAGLHSLAASSLGGDEPPDEDAFVCGDDADAKAIALEVART